MTHTDTRTHRRLLWTLAGVAVLVIAAVVTALLTLMPDTPQWAHTVQQRQGNAAPAAASTSSSQPDVYQPGDSMPESTPPMPTADSFSIGLKTMTKHCFGSAGCNVVVQPTVTYNGMISDLDTWTCSITYKITGGSDGETIETAEGVGGSQFSVSESLVSTASSSAKLTAKVQDVSCQ